MEQKTKIDDLQEKAIERLLAYLDDNGVTWEMARVAQGTLSAVARIRATDRVKDATQYNIVRSLAGDQEELKKYIALTLPHLTPMGLLDRPKK